MKGRRETAFFFADQWRSGTERVATSSLEYAQPNRKGCVLRPRTNRLIVPIFSVRRPLSMLTHRRSCDGGG